MAKRKFETTPERSALMSKIRSSGNKTTELALIKIFQVYGITGWRRNSSLVGKPDFVFKVTKVAVFVDGCFWHGCKACSHPMRSNAEYWEAKILRNRRRDRKVSRLLRDKGWTVIRVWEHSLKQPEKVANRVLRYNRKRLALLFQEPG